MSFFKKEKWALVKTVEASVKWTDTNLEDTIIYYLYESDKGNRTSEIKTSGGVMSDTFSKRHGMYLKVIYPWLEGQNFDHIPTYLDVSKISKEHYVKKIYSRFFK